MKHKRLDIKELRLKTKNILIGENQFLTESDKAYTLWQNVIPNVRYYAKRIARFNHASVIAYKTKVATTWFVQ